MSSRLHQTTYLSCDPIIIFVVSVYYMSSPLPGKSCFMYALLVTIFPIQSTKSGMWWIVLIWKTNLWMNLASVPIPSLGLLLPNLPVISSLLKPVFLFSLLRLKPVSTLYFFHSPAFLILWFWDIFSFVFFSVSSVSEPPLLSCSSRPLNVSILHKSSLHSFLPTQFVNSLNFIYGFNRHTYAGEPKPICPALTPLLSTKSFFLWAF